VANRGRPDETWAKVGETLEEINYGVPFAFPYGDAWLEEP
jgi:hypothetical protein